MVAPERRRGIADESGWAMIAVIGLMALSLLLATTITTQTISAIGGTSVTRASVQAQAAADAGLAEGQTMLNAGTCTTTGGTLTGTQPTYRVTTWTSMDQTTWTRGCPVATTAYVRLIATGTAEDAGATRSGGDVRHMEAIYAAEATSSVQHALYVGGSTSLNAMKIVPGDSTGRDIVIESGNFVCTSPTSLYEGDVIVPNGSADIANACTITGDVYASKGIKIHAGGTIFGDLVTASGDVELFTSALIKGNVYAAGNFTTHAGGTIEGSVEATKTATLSAGTLIKGDLWANYVKEIRGKVAGSVTSAAKNVSTLITSGTSVDVRVGGLLTVGGNITTTGALLGLVKCLSLNIADLVSCTLKSTQAVLGSISLNATVSAPGIHIYAGLNDTSWRSFKYDWAQWQAAGWSRQLVWPADKGCQIDNYNGTNPASALYPFWQSVLSSTVPTVLDTRACATVNLSSSAKVQLGLRSDLAIVGKGIKLEAVNVVSLDGKNHLFHLINPNGDSPLKLCIDVNAKIELNSSVKIDAKIKGMVYTPCTFNVSGPAQWNGQVYVGSINESSGDQLIYSEVTLPGDTFAQTTVGSSRSLNVLAIRDRPDSGE